MKILGFAHATFANVVAQPGDDSELKYSFSQIPDSPAKRDWLKGELGLHSIQIYNRPLPFEITTYSNSTSTKVKLGDVIERFFNSGVIFSSSFNVDFFQFLLHFSSNAFLKNTNELQINQLSLGKFITFRIERDADPMAEFLDDSSLACLAFYVDEISLDSLEKFSVSHHFEKMSEEFEVNLKANRYLIRLLRVKGVNIELITRS